MVMPIIKMQFDGQYLETLVSGYRTLTVEGREELDLNVINAEIDTSDGGRYLRRKIKSRVLNVRFAVEDSTPEGFAVKFKALKAELYKIKESQIIFTDEPGIYLAGKFGVRIEDMIVIDGGTPRNITKFPKALQILPARNAI